MEYENKGSAILTLRYVRFRYPQAILPENQEWLLKIDHFSFASNTAYSLLGDNMTGKSTLIRLLTGTLPALPRDCIEGIISVARNEYELPVNPVTMKKLGLAVVHQFDPMFPEFSIWENIALGCPSQSILRKQKVVFRITVSNLLDNLYSVHQVSPDSPLAELSGGGRALFKILRANIWSHKLLLLDEPVVHLDPGNRIKCFELLEEMWRPNASIMLVSHIELDHQCLAEIANKRHVVHQCFELKDGVLIKATL